MRTIKVLKIKVERVILLLKYKEEMKQVVLWYSKKLLMSSIPTMIRMEWRVKLIASRGNAGRREISSSNSSSSSSKCGWGHGCFFRGFIWGLQGGLLGLGTRVLEAEKIFLGMTCNLCWVLCHHTLPWNASPISLTKPL